MKRGLVDLSSLIWTSLLFGEDNEHGRLLHIVDDVVTELPRKTPKVEGEAGKRVHVNSWRWGYDNSVRYLLDVMEDLHLVPRDLIIVVEGKNAKAERQALHPGYKAGRDKVEAQYEQFNLCKEKLLDTLCNLGAQACWQDGGVEADDVLGYLATHLQGERWIISGDKDLAAVVGGDIHHYRRGKRDENPFGDFPHSLIPVYIALVGDSSDKITGAKGFGEKAFINLHLVFGNEGLELMQRLILNRQLGKLAEDVGELRELQKILDDTEGVYLSYELARLRIEKVNTMKKPLQWRVGMVKRREQIEDSVLRKYGTQCTLVTAENYAEAVAFLTKHLDASPYFAFDVETSTPPESDDWLERQGKDGDAVDTFGAELTSFSITFGRNQQYTIYVSIDHVEEAGRTNITLAQARDLVGLIPKRKIMYVHNAAYELPVCFNAWGNDWINDPDWHGFLPQVRDTRIGLKYVDENFGAGLKDASLRLLGYEQQTYQQVTTITQFTPSGEIEYVQKKMNELTAAHVFGYGCDDTICTSAIANHNQVVMEIEGTWGIYNDVETLPAYVTALGFVQGVDFSLEDMAAMEREDDALYDKSWAVLRDYLMKIGFEGTRCPVFEELSPAAIKEGFQIITGKQLETKRRLADKIAGEIREVHAGDHQALLIAEIVQQNAVAEFNALVARHFDGEPQLNLGSPKQMRALLYDFIGIPVSFINDVTPKEKEANPDLEDAARRFKKKLAGSDSIEITAAEMDLLRAKAKSDDDAIEYALAFDEEVLTDESRTALRALGSMKKVMTRRGLFYKTYWHAKHWKDGKIHSSMNQCAAVTRRYSSSGPNLQQVPKKGEAVRFRGCFKPHHKDAVIASIDFTGQELRLAAERSQDPNMVACYVGDKLKDLHSLTAAGAMRLKWGDDFVNQMFREHGADLPVGLSVKESEYELFLRLRKLGKDHPIGKKADDLRKDSKNVNFAAQFGGRAVKLAQTLIMEVEDARLFLEARSEAFPLVDAAAERAAAFVNRHGFAETLLGARRHLRDAIMSDDKMVMSAAERQGWNMEIQGSAAEMSKLAMASLWRSGALHRYDVRFFAPIHDELVTSVHRDHAIDFLRIKHACMTQPYADMKVPILGSISIGPDFAEQVECGDFFIEENIRAALNDIFAEKVAA